MGDFSHTQLISDIGGHEMELLELQSEARQLIEADEHLRSRASLEMEVLNDKIRRSKARSNELLEQIQRNEITEHRLVKGLKCHQATLSELSGNKKQLVSS